MSKIIIYQVLPRLFGNTNSLCKQWGTKAENGVGKFSDFTKEALAQIKSLGVTHIWYTGVIEHATATDYSAYGIAADNSCVVKGLAGSPYAIKDYYDVDPDLAECVDSRMGEFCDLLQRTHDAGLKVIMDFVPNHVARQYCSDSAPAGVVSLGEEDDKSVAFSVRNNFYYIPGEPFSPSFSTGEGTKKYEEYPAKVTGNDCFSASPSVNDWYETVKLNYGIDYSNKEYHFDPIPDTWIKMRDILLFWASKGIDAFRCDMAEMVPVEFWQWCITAVRKAYPNIIFIAEVYDPSKYAAYVKTGGFDYLYDKVGLYDTLRGISSGNTSADAITWWWQSLGEVKENMLHFTENHDEQRSASPYFAGSAERALPLFSLSALIDKNPVMLYFGQELGEEGMDAEGFSGVDGRTTIFDYWSIASIRESITGGLRKLSPLRKKIRQDYKAILSIASKQRSISEGEFFDLMYANRDKEGFDTYSNYLFARCYKKTLLIIAVNFSSSLTSAEVAVPEHMLDYFGLHSGEYQCTELLSKAKRECMLAPETKFKIEINPYGTAIWSCVQKKV